MKKIMNWLLLFMSMTMVAQSEFQGQWVGTLNVQGIRLRVVFNVAQTENGFTTTMDSPDQGVKDIPFPTTEYIQPNVKFEIPGAIEYTGVLSGDKIEGTFKQAGMSVPLQLTKNTSGEDVLKRPQEPKKPYPYHSEDITFKNQKQNIELHGTLTLPDTKGTYPAVVLISGSGAQNRDSELLGHKPFLIWADYLTRNGIAVLRFDDRIFNSSESMQLNSTIEDFATDVESAVNYLKSRKEINKRKIGLIGHSEGGVVAPIVAATVPSDVNFIVLLAGSGVSGGELLLLQQKLIAKASNVPDVYIQRNFEMHTKLFGAMNQINDEAQLKTQIEKILNEFTSDSEVPQGMTKEELISLSSQQYLSKWMLNFIRHNPAVALKKVKCPVLAINGEKDLQVPATENLTAIKNTLEKSGNKKVTVKSYPNLNHLFQECETGLPQEYSIIEQTIAPEVLEDVTQWIKTQTK